MAETSITGDSTMQEVLDAYPSAQRALFKQYHIGGCSSCGYQPDEKLASVAANHDIQDVQVVLDFLETSAEADAKLMVSLEDCKAAIDSKEPPRILDVRTAEEFETAHLNGSLLFTREVNMEMSEWPKETPVLFVCHTGSRSMDAASFFAGHGFSNVRSMTGGLDAWSREIDTALPRYEIVRQGKEGVIKPLNDALNQA